MLSSAAHAAGLGKLTVLSALGQPLRAEIELTAVSAEEANGLVAKLAAPDAFRTANIEFNPALLSLRFNVEQRSGRQIVRITSSQPINEPFVDMLLELSWSSGRLVREYTFLLDPAELRATQPAQVAAPADTAPARPRPQSAPAQARGEAAAPAEAPPPRRARPDRPARSADAADDSAAAPRSPAASEYRVKQGDTLGRIAAQLKPVDVSLDMMLVALYRANPDAFIGNNMNRLKSGQILSVPDSDALRGSGAGDAHGVVVAHAADFNAYRNKLAGQVAASTPAKQPQATQSAAGKITAKVEERPTAANESADKLQLSKAAPAAGKGGKAASAGTEDTIAREKEVADATARVKELERNVSDLEKLVVVKNKAGADAVSTAKENTAAPAAPAAAPTAQPIAPQKAPIARKKPIVTTAPAPEPSLVDKLMDNITYVGAGLAVLLLALFGLAQRRKKGVVRTPSNSSLLGAASEPAPSMFDEAGGQSVDTNNSVFNSSFAPSASQLDTNEVDPVAEADVYIAYGRDAQAEEILKEALRTHPERFPVRLKLLEIYAARKDLRSFETQAGELYSMTRGEGEEWRQAAAMGMQVDPANPLYANAAPAAADVPGAAPAVATAAALAAVPVAVAAEQSTMAEQLAASFASSGAQPDAAHFDIDSIDSDLTALPHEPAQPIAGADEHTLDFDLGGLDFQPAAAAPAASYAPPATPLADMTAVPDMEFTSASTAAPAPAVETPSADPFDMDFDMNFDAAAVDAAAVDAPAAPVAAQETALTPEATHDFSQDFTHHAASEPAPVLNYGDAGPASTPELISLAPEVALPELPTASAETPAASSDFDLDAMDFTLPTATPAADALPAPVPAVELPGSAPKFDMSGIDLDLPDTFAESPAPMIDPAPVDSGIMSAAQMEMETKLDLAIAYQEIGDKEGARELLDEVIKGGNSEQVTKANAMRAQLA